MSTSYVNVALLALAVSATQAWASPCDDFDMLKFDPSELERRIKELKFNETVAGNTRDTEIKLLQLQVCNLALALSQLKPIPEDVLKSYCPFQPKAKKTSPK
jgi:hypothetical protein